MTRRTNRLWRVRKSTAALSVFALTALALTGCSAAPSFNGESCERDSSDGLAAAVEVTGELGSPRIDMAAPVRTESDAYADLIVGDGQAMTADNQSAIVALTLANGETGQTLGEPSLALLNSTEAAKTPGLETILPCVTEGSRVVFSLPTNDLGGSAAQFGMGADENVIIVADFLTVALPKAEGADVFNTKRGLPSVVRAPDGRPGIIIPDSDAPTEVVTETLIEGDGDVVGEASPLFQLTAVNWDDRQVLTTTWDGPVSVDSASLPADVLAAVQAATVGSQVLVVLPGEGEQSAQAFVVDILGLLPPELAG